MNLSTSDIMPPENKRSEGQSSTEVEADLRIEESYFASIHIPSFVYWARVFSPKSFSELVVVSPKTSPNNSPANSAESSRNNTDIATRSPDAIRV